MKIILSGERAPSLNKIYQSRHWTYRKKIVDDIHEKVKLVLSKEKDLKMFDCRVDILVTAYFDKRCLDSSNIVLKIYEDALKGIVIKDDSHKYVRRVSTQSEIDRSGSRVEIEIFPIDN